MAIEVKSNEEFHDLLEFLAERKLFGEVTLFVQGGNIEGCRISERYTKTEAKALMESRKSKSRVLTARKKDNT